MSTVNERLAPILFFAPFCSLICVIVGLICFINAIDWAREAEEDTEAARAVFLSIGCFIVISWGFYGIFATFTGE